MNPPIFCLEQIFLGKTAQERRRKINQIWKQVILENPFIDDQAMQGEEADESSGDLL